MSRPISQHFRSRQPVVVCIERGNYARIISVHSTLNAAERMAQSLRRWRCSRHSNNFSWISGVTEIGETKQVAARRIGEKEAAFLWGADAQTGAAQ